MTEQTVKVSIRNLYKIFGEDPQGALQKVQAGMSKPDLLDQTGHGGGGGGVADPPSLPVTRQGRPRGRRPPSRR